MCIACEGEGALTRCLSWALRSARNHSDILRSPPADNRDDSFFFSTSWICHGVPHSVQRFQRSVVSRRCRAAAPARHKGCLSSHHWQGFLYKFNTDRCPPRAPPCARHPWRVGIASVSGIGSSARATRRRSHIVAEGEIVNVGIPTAQVGPTVSMMA